MRDIRMQRGGGRFTLGTPEQRMLGALSATLGVALEPAMLILDGETRLEIEGAAPDASVVCQIVANQGAFTSQHRNRVHANLYKLAWLATSVFPDARAVLAVSPTTAQAFTPTGWATLAARDLGVEVFTVADDLTVAPVPGTVR